MGGHRHCSALRQPSCHAKQLKIRRCLGGADVCHADRLKKMVLNLPPAFRPPVSYVVLKPLPMTSMDEE